MKIPIDSYHFRNLNPSLWGEIIFLATYRTLELKNVHFVANRWSPYNL